MDDIVDWVALRSLFPVTQRWVFFDHAAVAPLSRPAQEALIEYACDLAENGDVPYRRWMDRIEAVRTLAARLLHAAAPTEIAFVKNTSEGIGLVAEGIRWESGDNVVIPREEYPANVYPWLNLADRGVEVRFVPTVGRRIRLDDIQAAMDHRTKVVSISWVEFSSGFRNDLQALGELCRERGCWLFVDAIQGLGVFPLNVQELAIDFLAADGHKWLLSPEGAGLLWIRPEVLGELRPLGVGWNSVVNPEDFSTIDFRLKPHAGRYESGSLNVAGIHALGASLDLLLRVGIERISQRVLSLTDRLCAGLRNLGWPIYSSRLHGEASGIVSVEVPGHNVQRVVRLCRQEGIVVNQRAGRLRISPHCYNTEEEIDRLVEVLGRHSFQGFK